MLQLHQRPNRTTTAFTTTAPALRTADTTFPIAYSLYSQESRIAWLALWMAGSILSFVAGAVSVRALANKLSVFEIVSVRSASGLAILAAVLMVRRDLGQALTFRRTGLHVVRNSVHFVGNVMWTLAITLLPLATVFALEFTMPIWLALFAVIFLGERLTATRASTIGLCLVGVFAILHPGLATFRPAALLALGAAITLAVTSTATKSLTQTESPFAILFWMNLMQLPMTLVGSNPFFITKLDPSMIVPLIGVAAAGLSTHLCIAQAFRYGDAIVVVPLDFLRVPLIALLGWSLYGESLDALVFAGAALIIAGVIWNLRLEARRRCTSSARL